MYSPSARILPALLLVAAVAAIASAGGDPTWQPVHFVAKPLATIAAVLIAATARDPVSIRYRRLLVAGLAASLVGDVLLMLPGDHFLPGLASFLVAHLCYLSAFLGESRFASRPSAIAGYALVSGTLLWWLLPSLPRGLVVPVAVYVSVIATMAAQSATWMLESGSVSARRAAIGAAGFVVSDATLAVDRFRTQLPYRELAVLGTYFVAQWCLARSVSRRAAHRTDLAP